MPLCSRWRSTWQQALSAALLNDAQCRTAWKVASSNGATLSKDQAEPYIVDVQVVDFDGDAVSNMPCLSFAAGVVYGSQDAQVSDLMAPAKKAQASFEETKAFWK